MCPDRRPWEHQAIVHIFKLVYHVLGTFEYFFVSAPLNMHSHRGREDPGPETGKCQPGKGENLEKNKKG